MKKSILTLLLVFTISFGFAQTLTTKTSIYFKSNKFDLQKSEKSSLDTLILFLSDKEIQNIFIQGNTDSDADSLYNIDLSQKRALTVRNYLEENAIATSLFTTEYIGENNPIAPNSIDNGKRKNRRVDVIINYRYKNIVEEPKKEEKKSPEKPTEVIKIIESTPIIIDTCQADTTIILPQGSSYTINICDYIKYKDSIKIIEFLSPESILNSDLLTITTNNEQLITSGMFDVKICDSCKLRQPLTFRVPIINNGEFIDNCGGNINYRKMSLWKSRNSGAWGGSEKIEIVKSNDSLFYQFRINGSGKFNLDYKLDKSYFTNVKTKIKASGSIRLLKVRMFYQQSIYQKKLNNKNQIAQFQLPKCPSSGCNCIMIKAIGINENGDTLVSSKCLNDYTKRIVFGKCKLKFNNKPHYLLGFIPVRRKGIYRKYIIEPKDWVEKNKG
jgi:OmpA family